MNQINNSLFKEEVFFFYIDSSKEFESRTLKIKNFFPNFPLLHPVNFFSVFNYKKIDFDFLEKNEKLLFFFYAFNKFFFKNQTHILNFFSKNEKNLNNSLNFKFNFNFFFFTRHIYSFIFMLKRLSFKNKNK